MARSDTAKLLPGDWLVVAAWSPELALLRRAVPRLPAALRRRVKLASVGIGLVDAGIGTARLLAQHHPEGIILVGTAGVYPGHAARYLPGQTVIAGDTVLLAAASAQPDVYLPSRMRQRQRATPRLGRALRLATSLPVADVACPIPITRSSAYAASAEAASGCALENLEAFSVACAAAAAKIPMAAVLGIANRVGPRGHAEWQIHGKRAAESACRAVVGFLLAQALPGARAAR